MWLQADTATGLNDGDQIATWTDASGLGHDITQATAAKRPLYKTSILNGLPVVRFDGTDDFMATAAYASPTAGGSLFAVVKVTASAAYRLILNHASSATWTGGHSRFQARVQDSGPWQFIVNDDSVAANALNTFPTNAVTGTWLLMTFIYDQTNLIIASGGTNIITKGLTGTLTSSTFPVYVGASTDGLNVWNGDMAELVYYDNGLNSTDRAAIEKYLTDKWFIPRTIGFVPRRMPLGV